MSGKIGESTTPSMCRVFICSLLDICSLPTIAVDPISGSDQQRIRPADQQTSSSRPAAADPTSRRPTADQTSRPDQQQQRKLNRTRHRIMASGPILFKLNKSPVERVHNDINSGISASGTFSAFTATRNSGANNSGTTSSADTLCSSV